MENGASCYFMGCTERKEQEVLQRERLLWHVIFARTKSTSIHWEVQAKEFLDISVLNLHRNWIAAIDFRQLIPQGYSHLDAYTSRWLQGKN